MIDHIPLLLFICCFSVCTSSFRYFNSASCVKRNPFSPLQCSNDKSSELLTNPSRRLLLTLEGPNVNNAIFRAELKKELTFFRGCSAQFLQISDTRAEVVAEGKTIQLERFLKWLRVFGTSLRERKPNFQGPSLVVFIIDLKWTDYVGNISGFAANVSSDLSQPDKGAAEEGIEVSTMMGTDESV